MPLPELLRYVVAAALTGVLVWAAVSDAIWRRIPNASVLAVVALYAVWAVLVGGAGLVGALVTAVLFLAVGFGLFALRIWGGGDAKLLAAVALFAGFAHFSTLILVTAVAGGLMAVVSLASRPARALVIWNMKGKGDFGRGIPYGVAIAAGGAIVIWGQLLGWIRPYAAF
ncbi:A24 family peptidase [Phenylobacterium sp.]|uniref:A24 family peptidase n=1 Tax=Phenylobacterium sp. TaxID=1871053 RepID=UPI002EDA87B2